MGKNQEKLKNFLLPPGFSSFYPAYCPAGGPGAGRPLRAEGPHYKLARIVETWLQLPHRAEFWLAGGNQVGKTLMGQLIAAYTCTQLQEDAVIFAPSIMTARSIAQGIGMALREKFDVHFSSSFLVFLQQGATLWWRGQSDSQRAQVTSRVIVVSEVDKIRKRSHDESDPLLQILARTYAYDNAKIFFESTFASSTGPLARAKDEADVVLEFHHRCPECGENFLPREDLIFKDGVACGACGVVLNEEKFLESKLTGEWKYDKEKLCTAKRIFCRFPATASMVGNNLPIMAALVGGPAPARRRLHMQFLALPPSTSVETPPEPCACGVSRGYVPAPGGGWWCLATDTGGRLHWVLLCKNSGEDKIFIADFGSVGGSTAGQLETLKKIVSTYPHENGLILYDYGYMGENYLRLWNRIKPRSKHSFVACRGMSGIRPDAGIDSAWGSAWRYRRMRGTGYPCLQVLSVAAKDLTQQLLYAGKIALFGTDTNREEIKNFMRAITQSEIPVDEGGKRKYKTVCEGNHYFDALVYAVCGIELTSGDRLDNIATVSTETSDVINDKVDAVDKDIKKSIKNNVIKIDRKINLTRRAIL